MTWRQQSNIFGDISILILSHRLDYSQEDNLSFEYGIKDPKDDKNYGLVRKNLMLNDVITQFLECLF